MTDNPLRQPAQPNPTSTSLQEFCDTNNNRAERMGADWWYLITTRTLPDGSKRNEVVKLEGHQAIDARQKHNSHFKRGPE